MLSSLGFDNNKGAGRTNHSGSRLIPNVPRGFSVHVFKNPTLPTHTLPPMAPAVIPSKYDTRPSNGGGGGGQWTRQQSYHAPHTTLATESSERKQLQAAPPSQDHRLIHVPAAPQNQVAWPVETKHAHAHNKASSKSYGIYPSLVGDVYVYERSISSVSFDEDELASSPSSESSSSSDSDLYGDRELALSNNTISNSNRNHNTATYPGSRALRAPSGNVNVEISSTRASSSTETLESTLTAAAPHHGARFSASALPPPPAPAPLPAPPRPASTRPQPHPERESSTVASARSAVPLTRAETQSQNQNQSRVQSLVQRSISVSAHAAVPPIQLASAPLEHSSSSSDGSDSETVISETHGHDMVVDMLGAQWAGPPGYGSGSGSSYPGPMRSATPFRDRVSSTYRRDAPPSAAIPVPAPRDPRDVPVRPSAYREDSGEPAHPRAPPGLSPSAGVVNATPPDGGRPRSPPRTREGGISSSPTHSSPASRSPPSAPSLARAPSSRQSPVGSTPGAPARNGNFEREMGSSSYPPPPHALQQPSSSSFSSSPPRREVRAPSPQHNTPPTTYTPPSAGQTPSPHGSPTAYANPNSIPPPNANSNAAANALVVAAATVAKRSVRWTENLVCPSPVPPESRRKGWFNRRGDQLWTNDGQYKMPEPGKEYPPDLAYYPEPNTGWMNEEGVRIDMQHRLVPKQPLRSALKRPKQLTA